ncbi:MAG: tetratricopeptide repeat protein [Alkalispirochaeta sp.]
MHRLVVVLVALVSLTPAIGSLPHQPAQPTGLDGYREAETLVFSEQGSTSEVRALLEDARRALQGESNRALRSYWIARTHLLLATHYNQREQQGDAERQAELGFAAVEDALDRDGEFSEGLRVQADLHAQMMFARGMFYMVRFGSEARRQAMRAMELDPDNIRARITVAGFYLNAPRVAGGDPEEGVAILEQALSTNPSNESLSFLILGLLAQTYIDDGDESTAESYLRRAAEIYPTSPWIAELHDRIASS